jgi:hypothetical protein
MKKFFDYIQLPNFDIAADAAATFKVVISFGVMHIFPTNFVIITCDFIAGTHDETQIYCS